MIYEYVSVSRDVEMQLYHEISTTGRGLHTRIKFFLGEIRANSLKTRLDIESLLAA